MGRCSAVLDRVLPSAVIDRVLPGRPPADSFDVRRGRMLVVTSLSLAVAVPVGLGVRLAFAGQQPIHPAMETIAVSCAVVFGVAPWLLKTRGSRARPGLLVVAALYLLIVGAGWFAAGLQAAAVTAAPLLPLVATYLLGPRGGILTTLLLLPALVLFVLLPYWGVAYAQAPLTGTPELVTRTVVLGLTVALAGLFAAYSDRQRTIAEALLRQREALFRRLFEQSKDVVVISTATGRIADVNQAGLDLYGFHSKEEMLSADVWQLYADREERRNLVRRLESEGYVKDHETLQKTRAGEVRIIQGTTSTIRKDDGSVELLLSILRDVTRRRRSEAECKALVQELASKNAELERFSRAVSHDLKSPLTTIRGYLGLLKSNLRRGELDDAEEFFHEIDEASKKMGQMIDGLLRFHSVHRSAPIPQERVDLTEVARDAVRLLGQRIAESGAQVEISLDLPRVDGDPSLWLVILQNLIDNAVKFSACRLRPRVSVGSKIQGGETVVFVADNGVGIPPQDQDRIFGLFEKLNPEDEGTGIGLASVQRAVEAHGGRIWVESAGTDRGCTFCFTIPTNRTPGGVGPLGAQDVPGE